MSHIRESQKFIQILEEKKDEEVTGKNDKKVKTSDDEVIRLNKSLLEWCKAHLEKDPVCDFRPVFDDYKKHMDKIDKVSLTM